MKNPETALRNDQKRKSFCKKRIYGLRNGNGVENDCLRFVSKSFSELETTAYVQFLVTEVTIHSGHKIIGNWSKMTAHRKQIQKKAK